MVIGTFSNICMAADLLIVKDSCSFSKRFSGRTAAWQFKILKEVGQEVIVKVNANFSHNKVVSSSLGIEVAGRSDPGSSNRMFAGGNGGTDSRSIKVHSSLNEAFVRFDFVSSPYPGSFGGYQAGWSANVSFTVKVEYSAGGGTGSGGTGGGAQAPITVRPALGSAAYTFTQYKGFGLNREYTVRNLVGGKNGKVTLKKIGKGKLPSGMKLKYDKKTGKVILSGAPQKAGKYEYVVRIDEKVGKKAVQGVETKFSFTINDMGNLSSSHTDYNPAVGKVMKTDIPVFGATSGNFAGLLNVSVTKQNKISAKIKGVSAKSLSFSGTWQSVEKGVLSTTLVARTGETLYLMLKRNGNLCASLSNLRGIHGTTVASTAWGIAGVSGDYAKYVGVYTFMTNDGDKLTLKISKKGKISYKAERNKLIRGTAQLLLNAYSDGSAQAFLVKSSSKISYAYRVKF